MEIEGKEMVRRRQNKANNIIEERLWRRSINLGRLSDLNIVFLPFSRALGNTYQ
jgi:hypothetical protein